MWKNKRWEKKIQQQSRMMIITTDVAVNAEIDIKRKEDGMSCMNEYYLNKWVNISRGRKIQRERERFCVCEYVHFIVTPSTICRRNTKGRHSHMCIYMCISIFMDSYTLCIYIHVYVWYMYVYIHTYIYLGAMI